MFRLEEITTKDGLIHQGLVAYPENLGKIAVIWVHGLTGTFYGNSNLLKVFAAELTQNGIAFATFNNRGHDMISGFRKIDETDVKGYSYETIGAGFEVFEDCVYDLDSAVKFFADKGYEKIILAGHSSGANKVCYYAGTIKNSLVSGIALLCPMSDRLDPSADKKEIEKNLKKCFALVEKGREDALVTDLHFFPMTAKRYISLVTPHTSEDQFGYGDTPSVMNDYQQIHIPLFVLFAEKDEFADRPIKEIKKIFDQLQKSSQYTTFVIPNALHNLANQEGTTIKEISSWIKKIA